MEEWGTEEFGLVRWLGVEKGFVMNFKLAS